MGRVRRIERAGERRYPADFLFGLYVVIVRRRCVRGVEGPRGGHVGAALRVRSAVARPDVASPSWGNAQGIDISDANFPPNTTTEPEWSTLKNSGVSFVGIKATEGDYYTDEPPYPSGDTSTFVGYHAATTAATAAGLDVMPYVFGNPHAGNGTAQCQADYGWQEISPAYGSSSLMLPVTLDIEQDPYATVQSYTPASGQVDLCYNQTASGMVTWITDFLAEMKADSGKNPVIYTNPTFWSQCVDNSTAFTSYPFWLADYGVPGPAVVAGWNSPALWQYTDAVTVDGMSGAVDGNYAVTQDAQAWDGGDAIPVHDLPGAGRRPDCRVQCNRPAARAGGQLLDRRDQRHAHSGRRSWWLSPGRCPAGPHRVPP